MGLTSSCQKEHSAADGSRAETKAVRRPLGPKLRRLPGCNASIWTNALLCSRQKHVHTAHFRSGLATEMAALALSWDSWAAGCCFGSRAEAVHNLALLCGAGPCIMSSKAAQHGTLGLDSFRLTCSHCCSMVLCM